MIRHVDGRWYLLTKDGSHVLGVHTTIQEAIAQEHAIRISKARAAGHPIPPAPPRPRERRR